MMKIKIYKRRNKKLKENRKKIDQILEKILYKLKIEALLETENKTKLVKTFKRSMS